MKHTNLSRIFCLLLLSMHTMPLICEEVETRAKDSEAIVAHAAGIAGNIINLMNEDKKTEDEIGANIVGLFGNILACIFAASKRGNIPLDITQEEIDTLFASLDEEVIEAIQKAVISRVKQIRSM